VHRYCNQWDFLVLDCWARGMRIEGFLSMEYEWDMGLFHGFFLRLHDVRILTREPAFLVVFNTRNVE
jgi:hypothetical protein